MTETTTPNPTTPKPAAPAGAIKPSAAIAAAIAAKAAAGKATAKVATDKVGPPPTKPAGFGDIDYDGPEYRYKAVLRVKIGEQIFSSLNGDFLMPAIIKLSSYQHSTARLTLNDPDDSKRLSIKDQKDAEVELGFGDGPRRSVLVGKIYSLGRRQPDGTELVIVDPAYQLQKQTGSSATFSGAQPVVDDNTGVAKKEVADKTKTGDKSADKTTGKTADKTAADKAKTGDKTQDKTTPAIATNQTSGSAPVAAGSGNSFGDLLTTLQSASKVAEEQGNRQDTFSPAETFTIANHADLKFRKNTDTAISNVGSIRVQESEMMAAQREAMLKGDVIITRGNTVQQVGAGKGDPSGLTLDYVGNREAFIGKPTIIRRTGMQLQSGFGSLTVQGWNPTDKTMVGVTVNTPDMAMPGVPGGVIQVPEWGQIKMDQPLFQGSSFTWGDVTRNGQRVPTKEIMQRAVKLAIAVEPIVKKSGQKWNINSWFRRQQDQPAHAAKNSRHLYGDGFDVSFPGMQKVHDELSPTNDKGWRGGIAICYGSYIHIDIHEDPPFRRWVYN